MFSASGINGHQESGSSRDLRHSQALSKIAGFPLTLTTETMPQFYTGDELGKIKLINCSKHEEGWNFEEHTVYTPLAHAQFASGESEANGIKSQAIQRLASVKLPERVVSMKQPLPCIPLSYAISLSKACCCSSKWDCSRFFDQG